MQAAILSELYLSDDIARTTMDAENSISMQNVVLIAKSEKKDVGILEMLVLNDKILLNMSTAYQLDFENTDTRSIRIK